MEAPPEAAVAVTDRAERRRRRKRGLLRDLPWVAAGIGSLAARHARAQSSADTKILFYKESNGRTQVIDPVVLIRQDLGEGYGHLGILLGYDSISGASPTGAYPTADVTTSASGHVTTAGNFPEVQYKDTRKSASLSWDRKFGAHLPTIDVSYAKENDYVARGAGISDSWSVFHELGTIHFGVSFARDLVEPVKNPTTNPTGASLQYKKSEDGYSLGYTWILGERDVVDFSASLMQLRGYLNDPYKVVSIGPSGTTDTAAEQRPDTRSRRAFVAKYGHHFLWDGAIRVTYRYYNDSWSIQAHTLDVVYDQRLDPDWMVSPLVRLYTQTGASFYTNRLPAPLPLMSADYRLSALDSILFGLTLSYKINPSLSVNLGGTYQSQVGRDRVVPITTGNQRTNATVSSADLNITTITVGLTKLY